MALIDVLSRIADSLEKIAEHFSSSSQCSYTLYSWLSEWERSYKSPKLRDGGYDLRMNINKHILPNIPDKPLNEYTAHDITTALTAIRSERMRQIVRQIYNQSFREAVRAGYITSNPVDNVDYVKHSYNNGRSLTLAEQSEFLRVISGDRFDTLFRFYLFTGARPSEPLAVKWSDVTDSSIRIAGTKTVRSDRLLPLSDKLKALLDTIPKEKDFIFPYSYQSVMRHFNRIVRPKLSFDMTIKDLRHTFATRCAEAGINIKTVQKWMGHSNFGTTANIYSHVLSQFELEEVKKLDST